MRSTVRCFGDAKDTIDSKQLKNQIYLLRFGHTRALLLKKKRTRNGHFPRPRETDPYEQFARLSRRTLTAECVLYDVELSKCKNVKILKYQNLKKL